MTATATIQPGVYRNMPADTYHATWPCLSSSGARKLLDTCPARFHYDRTNPPPSTDALDFGSLAHAWLLEPDAVNERYAILPEGHNGSTKEGKALVADIIASGRKPIKYDDWQTVRGMAAALDAHPFAGKLFANGKSEVSLFWQDADTGIMCRARPDWLPARGSIVTDYKTLRSVNPEDLAKSMWEYGYYQQAAWYCDGLAALGLIERPQFAFCFQEKRAPYLVTVATVSATAMEWGRIRNRKAREIFARCLETGVWPGYDGKNAKGEIICTDNEVVSLDLPKWAENQLEQEHAAGLYAPAIAAE